MYDVDVYVVEMINNARPTQYQRRNTLCMHSYLLE